MTGSEYEVRIDRLGARGDGIVDRAEGPLFVPFGLPGEAWVCDGALPVRRVRDSTDRIAPVCPHFTHCGGCSMQHLATPAYAEWKRGLVAEALRQQGIAAAVEPLVEAVPHSRRRAVLTARGTGGGLALGFHAARSHDVVDISVCPVLSSDIVRQFDSLREVAALLAAGDQPLRLTVLACRNGLDVRVDDARGDLSVMERGRLAELVEAAGWARLSIGADPVVLRQMPELVLADVVVAPPPGAFVQATAEAEAAMQGLALRAAGKAKRVADLFSGSGTLAFALARRAAVLAVDSEAPALEALEAGRRNAQGLKPIEGRVRDLFLEPLARKELEPFDCVVFDPPRAGAKAQAQMLAKSVVPTVVAVSCNPATLARDLRTLVDGGYEVECITPIDQFLYTAHVEVVAVLRRPKGARVRRGR